jgi:hypothetical protein
MGGIVPNTLDSEALPPQHSITIVNNWVHHNHNRRAPAKSDTYNAFGQGIMIAGGNGNEVAYNIIEDHTYAGVLVSPNLDKNFWIARGNRVHDNTVSRSGVADIAVMAPAGGGNCFADNRFSTSLPPAIETLYGCGSPVSAIGGGDLGLTMNTLGFFVRSQGEFPHGDWKTMPAAPPQTTMPNLADAPGTAGPAVLDVSAELTRAGSSFDRARPLHAGAGFGGALYTIYGYVLPALFLLALGLRLVVRVRRSWLTGKRVLLGIPLLYIATSLLILAGGYFN